MATLIPSVTNRPTYSCVRCADRKVRCDKQSPCNHCSKHNVQCVFRAPPVPRKRQKRVADSSLKDKIRRYEAALQELGFNPAAVPATSETIISGRAETSSASPTTHPAAYQASPAALTSDGVVQIPTPASTVATEPERSITTTQILHSDGKSQFVENSLWSRMAQEFHDPEEALEDSSYEATDGEESEEDLGFVLDAPRSSKRYTHPSTDVIEQFWVIFTEHIDPLLKIVHVPSLEPAIRKAISNIDIVPRTFEALLFAIYGISVLSMKADECERRLGQDREKLLSYYVSATKWALSRANFMGTSSIVVLQALTLHLYTIRLSYGPRTVWTLTGVVVRIAKAMGLHRDGAELGLPPFEAEIRRRIWFQIKGHDFRASELAGFTKIRAFTDEHDTCGSLTNCNDADLYPGMSEPPAKSDTLTDSIFISVRTEFTNFAKNSAAKFKARDTDSAGNAPNVENSLVAGDESSKDAFVKEIQDILELKYIRFCDPSQPLQLYTSLVARSAINALRFMTHHPRSWNHSTLDSERAMVWKASIAILGQFEMLQSDTRLQNYSWYGSYFMQWHVLIHVLDTLRVDPLRVDAEKTWRLIEATWLSAPYMISDTKKAVHVAVGNLCLKAYSAYESALLHNGRRIPSTPSYIAQLRGQREVAKQKKAAREVRNKEALQAAAMTSQLDANMSLNDVTADPHVQWTGFEQSGLIDTFWYGNDGGGNMMDLDDFMIGQDNVMGDLNAGQHIDWTQWDDWVGGLNTTTVGGGGGSNAAGVAGGV